MGCIVPWTNRPSAHTGHVGDLPSTGHCQGKRQRPDQTDREARPIQRFCSSPLSISRAMFL
jgi:hypothetical protein